MNSEIISEKYYDLANAHYLVDVKKHSQQSCPSWPVGSRIQLVLKWVNN